MKNLLALAMIALFVVASVGCKNGLISKWRKRGAPCSQCNSSTVAPPTIASSPCQSGMCEGSSPYVTASPMVVPSMNEGSGYQFAPSSESGYFGSSSYGILPEPPGPIGN